MNQAKLSAPYLLVLFSVPYMRNAENQLCVSLAWAKDLIEHARYIENLTLVSYFSDEKAPADAVVIENNPTLEHVRFVLLPKPRNTLHALMLLPKTIAVLWAEINRTAIVHSAVAGWPLPEAWIICPILHIKKRFHFINVESAFWRLPKGQSHGLKQKIKATIWEYVNRWCVQSADLSTFTQDDYKKSLLGKYQDKGFVIPATWIDADNILTDDDLVLLGERKKQQLTQPIKLVFAGRLVFEKGILLLIHAVSELIDAGHPLTLDIYGDGALLSECEALITSNDKSAFIRLCGTVKYGPDFFTLLHDYDLMVIPSLSDEQPRNVFDAFSQALPVLCADTAGLLQCVESQKTGYFFTTGSRADLKAQLVDIMQHRDTLLNMSQQCVDYVKNMTHTQMHMKRLNLLNQALIGYSDKDK